MNLLHPLNNTVSEAVVKLPPRSHTVLEKKPRHKAELNIHRTSHCSKWRIPDENGSYEEVYIYEGDYYEYAGHSVRSGKAASLSLAILLLLLAVQIAVMAIPSVFSTVRSVEFFEVGTLASLLALTLLKPGNDRASGLNTIYEYRTKIEYYRIALGSAALFSLLPPPVMILYLLRLRAVPHAPEISTILFEALIAIYPVLLRIRENRKKVCVIENDHEKPAGSIHV